MNDDGVDAAIRRAIGGDAVSIAAILAGADTVDDAVTITMAALLQGRPAATGAGAQRREDQPGPAGRGGRSGAPGR